MKRRLTLGVICCFMVFSICFAAIACGDDEPIGDGDVNLLSYSSGAVMGLGDYEGDVLVIPTEYNGWSVTEISSPQNGTGELLDFGMTDPTIIAPKVDCRGTAVKKVVIGRHIKYITNYALLNTNIELVEIGSGVTEISENAFYGCLKLKNITVNGYNKNYCSIDGNIYSKDGKTLIRYAPGKTETEFTVPDTVTQIASGAFQTNAYLQKVIMGKNVTFVGERAFLKCVALKSVVYNEKIEKISAGTFAYCEELSDLTLPITIKSVEKLAFYCCDNFDEAKIPLGTQS